MKFIQIIFLIIVIPSLSFSQSCYDQLIKEGKNILQSKNNNKYKIAIQKFNSARRCDPSKSDLINTEIDKVFEMILAIKEESDRNYITAKNATKLAEDNLKKANDETVKSERLLIISEIEKKKAINARITADSLNDSLKKERNKMANIIDKLYFYKGRFAIGNKQGKYGFMDQNGNFLIENKYDNVTQFNESGFAQVERDSAVYLLDTLKNEYLLATTLKEITKETKAIDMSSQDLDSIPSIIFNNTQIKLLFLSENKIATIPDEIGKLDKLVYLDLSDNKIGSLPQNIGQLQNLSSLDVSYNSLDSLPTNFGKMKNLSYLSLYNNNLISIPSGFGYLKNLKLLYLHKNKLGNLRPEIGELNRLEVLWLGQNQLDNLPPQIENLQSLTYLDLSDNNLTSLPPQIRELKNLEVLMLYGLPIPIQEKLEINKRLRLLKIYP